jgi:hypothetical protein
MVIRSFLLIWLLLTQGCCGLCALFGCGGDRQPLVPVSWDSADEALQTLLAAVRFGDRKVIYESLSEEFKAANHLDGLSLAVVWERLAAQIPGLHLVGDARILSSEAPSPDRKHFRLEVHGYRFRIEFAARPGWDMGRRAGEEIIPGGRWVDDLGHLVKAVDPDKGTVSIVIQDPSLIGTARDDIAWVRVGRTWKVWFIRSEEAS